MRNLDEPYPSFDELVTQGVQGRVGSAWELEVYEGQPVPMNPDNLDPSLGPNQVRVYAWFTNWLRNTDLKFFDQF